MEVDSRAEVLVAGARWDEARRLLDRALGDARARGDRAGQARLLLRRGKVLTEQTRHRGGDGKPALADLEAARRHADAAGDPELIAAAIDALAMHRYVQWFSSQDPADLSGSEQLFRQALALREPRGDSAGLAESHFHVGLVHQMRHQADAAQREFELSLAIARRVRDDLRMFDAYRHLGYMAELRRDFAAAEQGYLRSLELGKKAGYRVGEAAALLTVADLRYARDGDVQRTWPLLARALAVAKEANSAPYVSIANAAMGRVRRDEGKYDEALEHFGAAIAATDEIGSDEDGPENLEQMALIHLLRDQPAPAVAEVDRGLARRSYPRLQALAVLARARAGQTTAVAPPDPGDPVVEARLALAGGKPDAALDAAVKGDDPDTLLLAARAVARPDGFQRARTAAAALSRAQELRFERLAR